MTHRIRNLGLVLFLLLFTLVIVPHTGRPPGRQKEPGPPVEVALFYGDWGCSACTGTKENHVTSTGFVQIGVDSGAEALSFLRSLAAQYPELEVHAYEVWMNTTSAAPFRRIAAAYGVEPSGVPMIFIGERTWQGFDKNTADEVTAYIELCLAAGCPSPADFGP